MRCIGLFAILSLWSTLLEAQTLPTLASFGLRGKVREVVQADSLGVWHVWANEAGKITRLHDSGYLCPDMLLPMAADDFLDEYATDLVGQPLGCPFPGIQAQNDWVFTYDAYGRLMTVFHTYHLVDEALGQDESPTHADTLRYGYDNKGRLISWVLHRSHPRDDPGFKEEFRYDRRGQRVERVIYQHLGEGQYQWEEKTLYSYQRKGRLAKKEFFYDHDGAVTYNGSVRYYYQGDSMIIMENLDANDSPYTAPVTLHQLDTQGRVVRELVVGDGRREVTASFAYADANGVKIHFYPRINGKRLTEIYHLDLDGYLVYRKAYDSEAAPPVETTWQYTRDDQGNVTHMIVIKDGKETCRLDRQITYW